MYGLRLNVCSYDVDCVENQPLLNPGNAPNVVPSAVLNVTFIIVS